MQHLDLALNVYYAAQEKARRWKTRLSQGKVTDATFRTHLFRIQGAPLNIAFVFGMAFGSTDSSYGGL
jgi:hypothetical protein